MTMKNQTVHTLRDIDLTETGGPFIVRGTKVKVEKVRKTGELWCDVEGSGHRHLYVSDVSDEVLDALVAATKLHQKVHPGSYNLRAILCRCPVTMRTVYAWLRAKGNCDRLAAALGVKTVEYHGASYTASGRGPFGRYQVGGGPGRYHYPGIQVKE